jgi:hypothetical protein
MSRNNIRNTRNLKSRPHVSGNVRATEQQCDFEKNKVEIFAQSDKTE